MQLIYHIMASTECTSVRIQQGQSTCRQRDHISFHLHYDSWQWNKCSSTTIHSRCITWQCQETVRHEGRFQLPHTYTAWRFMLPAHYICKHPSHHMIIFNASCITFSSIPTRRHGREWEASHVSGCQSSISQSWCTDVYVWCTARLWVPSTSVCRIRRAMAMTVRIASFRLQQKR